MIIMQKDLAYVTDGDVRLLVFPPAVERGSIIGLFWSNHNKHKDLVALDLQVILDWPFDTHTEHGEGPTMTLRKMFPPAEQLQEWVPQPEYGWRQVGSSEYWLRPAPFQSPIQGYPNEGAELWFCLYSATDNGVVISRASALWNPKFQISQRELTTAIFAAANDQLDLITTLYQADQKAS